MVHRFASSWAGGAGHISPRGERAASMIIFTIDAESGSRGAPHSKTRPNDDAARSGKASGFAARTAEAKPGRSRTLRAFIREFLRFFRLECKLAYRQKALPKGNG